MLDAALEVVDVDRIELDNRPRGRRATQAKRLAIWVWLHEYDGPQVDIARVASIDTGVVSYHDGQAMRTSGEYDAQACAVVALLARRRPRPRAKTHATEDALPVRYVVDVEET